MGYGYAHIDEIPLVDLTSDALDDLQDEYKDDREDMAEGRKRIYEMDIRPVDVEIGLENMRAKVWYFEEGDEITYHAHPNQEEFFYVMDGEFSLKLGPSGEEEYVEVGPGTFFAAGPYTGHGHRCISEEGAVLAIGAPNVDDEPLDPHEL
jgi:quercetin dioxygenase-like cupin family protein